VNEDACKRGSPVKCDGVVRLQHMNSGKYLHSHLHQSPISAQQEVSAYENSDTGDHWKVLCEEKGNFWKREQSVRLQHVDTSLYLSSNTKHRFGNPIPGTIIIVINYIY
jgi:dolichyl-phosphate-mannose--protein O-mannosyl transferase